MIIILRNVHPSGEMVVRSTTDAEATEVAASQLQILSISEIQDTRVTITRKGRMRNTEEGSSPFVEYKVILYRERVPFGSTFSSIHAPELLKFA